MINTEAGRMARNLAGTTQKNGTYGEGICTILSINCQILRRSPVQALGETIVVGWAGDTINKGVATIFKAEQRAAGVQHRGESLSLSRTRQLPAGAKTGTRYLIPALKEAISVWQNLIKYQRV